MKGFSKKKIGVIGLGKRYFKVYKDILESFDCDLYVWNRTQEKAVTLKNNKKYKILKNIKDFESINLDLCISFLPSSVSYDVLSSIKLKCNLLIETPVADQRWIEKSNVGVLEQWIYLPVEQMKELIYRSALISRPYWVFNDGRSFDYHAIAQLRKYANHKLPKFFFGKIHNVENSLGFLDKTGKINKTPDSWLHGVTTLENDVTLMHSFTYNCKMTNLKPFQLLRSTSKDGSIVSGRSHEMDNDYEMFEARYLNKERKVIVRKIEKIESEGKFLALKLTTNESDIVWDNKYAEYNFTDQQIAICDLLLDAMQDVLYTPLQSYCDQITIIGMKQSSVNGNILRMQ